MQRGATDDPRILNTKELRENPKTLSVGSNTMDNSISSQDNEQAGTENQLMHAISQVLGEATTESSLTSLISQLDAYREEKYGEGNIQDEIDDILKDIISGSISNDMIADYYFEAFFTDQKSKAKRLIQLCLIYTAIAQAALSRNKITEYWRAIEKATKYLSYYSGLNDLAKLNKSARGQTGGIKKAQNSKHLKNEIIALLIEQKPKKGWRIPQDAANTIVDDLIAIAKKENLPVPAEKGDLIHKLINLINDDKEVKQAFV